MTRPAPKFFFHQLDEQILNGQQWGPWQLHTENLTLILGRVNRTTASARQGSCSAVLYEIDLEKITDSAAMLDWIFQICNKTWATNEIVGCLVAAFGDLFEPQRYLCSFGQNKTIDPTEHLFALLEAESKTRG